MSEPYPPTEPPADGDRTSQVPPPRYSGSASVPVVSPGQPNPPGHPGLGQPGSAQPGSGQPGLGQPGLGQPGQGGAGPGQAAAGPPSPYGQGGYGPYGQPPAPAGQSQNPGSPRVAASASVPVPQAPPAGYSQPPPAGPPPGAPGAPGAPPSGGPGGYGSPMGGYSSPSYGQPPGGAYPGGPPAHQGGSHPSYGPGPGPMGQGGYQPAPYGQPSDAYSGQPASGGWPDEQAQPPRGSRRGLIIALIVAVIVVVVGIGGYVGWSLTSRSSDFTVGSCVKQGEGTTAINVDCGTAGAYEIKSIVDTEGGCPDASQPSLVLSQLGGATRYACLAPAAG